MKPEVQLTEHFEIPPGFRAGSNLKVQLWWIVRDTIFRASPQFMYSWRNWLLRLFGAKIGTGVVIRATARVTYPWKLSVDDHAWIGDYAEIYNLADITIGRNAVVSQFSYLCTGSHDYKSRNFDITAAPISVEEKAWVASGVMVYPGVTISEGSVIAARSVVKKTTKPWYIHDGHPAKPIKKRLEDAEGLYDD